MGGGHGDLPGDLGERSNVSVPIRVGKEAKSSPQKESRRYGRWGTGGYERGRRGRRESKNLCFHPSLLPLLPSLSYLLFFPSLQLRNPDTTTSEKKDPTNLCSEA